MNRTFKTSMLIFAALIFAHSNTSAQLCFNPKLSYPLTLAGDPSFCRADFNSDGKADLAVVEGGSVAILISNGAGSFATTTLCTAGVIPGSICSADFNGDNKPDLAITDNGPGDVSILIGNGAGSFSTATTSLYTSNYTMGGICSADFNGDSKPDLAISSGFNYLLVALGNGTGSFGTPTQFPAGVNTNYVISTDFNGDNKADLAVTIGNGASSEVSVILGNGAGSFGSPGSFSIGLAPQSLLSADFNGDGKMDLATANTENSSTGDISVLLGNGTGSFSAATSIGLSIGTIPSGLCSGDFNGDGKVDLAAATILNDAPHASVLLGTGTGAFGAATNFATDSVPRSIVSGDFNGDGKTDLGLLGTVNNNIAGKISVLLNCQSITGIELLTAEEKALTIYPNPNNGHFTIDPGTSLTVQLCDVTGQLILSLPAEGKTSLDVSYLKEGVYFLMFSGQEKIASKKMILVK